MSFTTFRDRVRRKVRRLIEPIAHDLLAWAQGADARFARIEATLTRLDDHLGILDRRLAEQNSRLDLLEIRSSSHDGQMGEYDHRLNVVESRLSVLDSHLDQHQSRLGESECRLGILDADRQRAVWEREALIERLNGEAARDEILIHKVSSLERVFFDYMLKQENMIDRLAAIEVQIDQAFWSRVAVIDRLNYMDARDEIRAAQLDSRFESIDADLAEVRNSVETKASLPTASELDALALSRRLGVLEDEVERLLAPPPDQSEFTRKIDLVSFPRRIDDSEKEAG